MFHRLMCKTSAVLVLIVGLLACAGRPAPAERPIGAPTVRAIRENPSSWEGRKVRLTGGFKGWSGSCRGAPPVSRSDWMLEDGTGCIYVTGLLPPGVSALTPKGEPLSLEGLIRAGPGGALYLEVAAP